jgi:quercetin dioxygenase-like cupin family protein
MRRLHILAAALAGPAALTPVAASVPQPGITRTDLTRSPVGVDAGEAVQVLVRFEPGALAQRHSHPGEELVYVIEGALEYRLDGKAPVTLRAGDRLLIPDGAVHAVRNVGSGSGAELATYIVEKGKPLSVLAD